MPNEPAPGLPVLVTTAHRGVFFGYIQSEAEAREPVIALRDARNCLYWSKATRGFLGLAAVGPDQDCRVGPKADLTLCGVTAVARVTPEACERWEAGPWRS